MFFRHLGVVGIDATLNSLEAVLRSEMWGNAYAFLTDEEGNAVLHPFIKPSAEVCVIIPNTYCTRLSFGVVKISLHSPGGGYSCYLKFAHSCTQTKQIQSRIFI